MSGIEGSLPPYAQIFDFLAEDDHRQLLDWAISISDSFKPATVSKGRPKREFRVDPECRIGLTTRKLGPLEPILRNRLLAALPNLMAAMKARGPAPTSLELELAAHPDGAFYRRHRDIPIGPGRQPNGAKPGEDRVLSAVYYFYTEPKAFSGGQLRLYGIGPMPKAGEQRPHIDLEPARNGLVAFPSWIPHEVRPVSCPTGQFSDYRFALNCWYCRDLRLAPS